MYVYICVHIYIYIYTYIYVYVCIITDNRLQQAARVHLAWLSMLAACVLTEVFLLLPAVLRAAQVRAHDDRAEALLWGIPTFQHCALSSYALTCAPLRCAGWT